MALKAGTIFVAVKGDLDPLDRALQAAWRASDKKSKQIEKAFTRMEKRVKRAWRSMTRGIGGALAGISLGALIGETIMLADKYTLLEGRLKLVTTSADNLKSVQNDLFKISQDTRTSYEGTIDVFTRLANATQDTDLKQQDLLKIVDTVNKSIVVSGTNATEAKNALTQFSQGLESGTLRGDELNSVLEQMPALARLIADGMGIAYGEIRTFASEGKITTEMITEAILEQGGKIDEQFKKMPLTVGQAWTKITNSMGKFISEANKTNGLTDGIAQAMDDLNDILEYVTGNMDDFLRITGSGLATIAKIAVAGGALWMLPVVIANTHKAMVLLQLTMFKAQSGAIGLNTALYGTSINARLAEGSLTKMKLAGSLMMAAFAGWELGKWANDNFEVVRKAGLAMVAGLDKLFLDLKFGTLENWVAIKYGFLEMAGGINTAAGDLIKGIADKFSGVSFTVKNPFGEDFQFGLDAASKKLEEVADKLKNTGDYTREHAAETAKLNKEYSKAIDIHDRTVEAIIVEETWTKKLGETQEEQTKQFLEDETKKVEIVEELSQERANLKTDMTDKIMQLTENEYDYKLWALEQEEMALYDKAQGDKEIESQVAEYAKLKQDEILEDFKNTQEAKKVKLYDANEIMKELDQAVVTAFVNGESAKESVAKLAKDNLIKYATGAANEGLPKILSGLGEAIGGWIGLGTAESETEGETWMSKIASGAAYLAQAGAAVLAGKAIGNNFAEGGWLGRHPEGGPINQGSFVRDDVFLGFTDGGSTINVGMGGEYVINQEATRANYHAIDYINKYGKNKRLFATGGSINTEVHPYGPEGPGNLWQELGFSSGNAWEDRPARTGGDSGTVAPGRIWATTQDITNSGMTVIGASLLASIFDFGTSMIDILGYYGGAALGMIGGKEVGKLLFKNGGEIGVNTFSIGGLITDAVNTLLGIFGWSVDDIWDELRSIPQIKIFADLLDEATFPFVRDTATPGASIGVGTIEDSVGNALREFPNFLLDSIISMIPGGDLLSSIFANGGILGSYATGTSYVPQTGPYMLHEGERVLTASENNDFMAMLRSGSMGGDITVEVKPQIKVMIGNREIKDIVLDVTDDYNAKRNRRGVSRTRYGTIG